PDGSPCEPSSSHRQLDKPHSKLRIRALHECVANRPGLALLDASPEDLRGYLRHLARSGRSSSHRRLAIFAIRWLYTWLARDLDTTDEVNPAKRVKVPSQDTPNTDYYTSEQFRALLGAARTAAEDFASRGLAKQALRARFDHAVLATLRYTGLRLNELINLQTDDIDLEDRRLHVQRGKGGKSRYVRIAKPLATVLTRYLNEVRPHCPASPWLFANPSGYPSGHSYGRTADRVVFAIVLKFATAAGLPGKHHPHRCRHGLATELVRHKTNPKTLQQVLGHSDLATTARYLHLDDCDADQTIDDIYPDEDDEMPTAA
ncbi:MAG: tyrosine-type recombinase/integrase, partial [Nitriliruptor sp.]|uniref:tyrosine-type recombinase/integrase n=1 Tax=Nitriliruptor sp. TaxID=2448056 RepID=UPI0034A077AF